MIKGIVAVFLYVGILLFSFNASAETYSIIGVGESSYHLRCADPNPDGCSGFWYQAGYDRVAQDHANSWKLGFGKRFNKWAIEAYFINAGDISAISGFTSDENFDHQNGGCKDPCEKQRWAYGQGKTTGVVISAIRHWKHFYGSIGIMKYRTKWRVSLVDFNMPGYPTRNNLAIYDARYYRGESAVYGFGIKLGKRLSLEHTIFSDVSTPTGAYDRFQNWALVWRLGL